MTHNPYLDWVFLDQDEREASLTAAQQQALKNHLESCSECRELALAWLDVDRELRTAPLYAPQAGFVERWQHTFELEQSQKYRSQGTLILVVSLSLAIGLLGVLMLRFWPYVQSPALLVWSYLYQVLRWASYVSVIQGFLGGLVKTAGTTIPLVGWALVVGVIFQLGVLWFVSYRYLTAPRSVIK